MVHFDIPPSLPGQAPSQVLTLPPPASLLQFEKASRGVATIQLDGLGSFDVFTSIRPSDPASKQAPLLTVAPPTDLLGAAQALLVGRTLVDVNGVPLEVAFRVDEGIATIQLRQPLIPKVPLPYDGSVRQPSIAAVNRARALAGGMPVAPDQAPAAAKKAQQRAPLTIQELEEELEQEIETGNFFSLEPNTKVVLDELGDAAWWRTPAFLGVAPETYGESLVGGVAAAYGLSYAVYVNDNKPKPKAAKPKPKPKPKPKAPDGDGGGGGGGEAAPAPKASAAPAGDEEKAAKKKAAPAAAKEAAPAPVAPPSAAAAGEAPLSKPLKVTSAAVSAAPAAAPAEEVTRWQRWVSGDWS